MGTARRNSKPNASFRLGCQRQRDASVRSSSQGCLNILSKAYQQINSYFLTSGHTASQFRRSACSNKITLFTVTDCAGRPFHTFKTLVLKRWNLTRGLDRGFANFPPRPRVRGSRFCRERAVWTRIRQAICNL